MDSDTLWAVTRAIVVYILGIFFAMILIAIGAAIASWITGVPLMGKEEKPYLNWIPKSPVYYCSKYHMTEEVVSGEECRCKPGIDLATGNYSESCAIDRLCIIKRPVCDEYKPERQDQ